MGSNELSWTTFHNIIDGKARSSEKFYQGLDPCTGEKLWDAPVATKQDMEDSVVAARKAFSGWRDTPFEKRIALLRAYQEGLKPHYENFTELLMRESGKPVRRILQITKYKLHSNDCADIN
jgi:acyl-CoA reductase-like NAD-dependent aldehyde dehydrogenase